MSCNAYRPLKNKSRLRGSGSLGQMSMGNNMNGFMNDPYITNSVGGEEGKAVSRVELHFFHLVSTGFLDCLCR